MLLKESSSIKILYDSHAVHCFISKIIGKIASLFKAEDKVIFLIVLKGGYFLASRMLSKFNLPENTYLSFIGVRSYGQGETKSGPTVNVYGSLLLTPDQLEDSIVFILDDVVETGKTLHTIKQRILVDYKPRSVYTCVLVDKKRERPEDQDPDIVGVEYEGLKFLIGCGMDFDEKYRELEVIGYIDPQEKL